MARYDFRTPRIFLDAALAPAARIALDADQANYLVNVLRRREGAAVLVFNGRDGEWQASLAAASKKQFVVAVTEQIRPQPAPGDLHYWFAPLKAARLDYMVQKAVEMGASRLQPVLTQHTQAERINLKRMRANAIEAAEQCGILGVPDTGEPVTLPGAWRARAGAPPGVLRGRRRHGSGRRAAAAAERAANAAAVLVGPEGGFTEESAPP